jgi:hypothetical protein
MQKYSYLIFPYRDAYFSRAYGNVVRDLQMVQAICSLESTHKVFLVNRLFMREFFDERQRIDRGESLIQGSWRLLILPTMI